jgi:murein DD-endopeptidase MepM/ murein hydrolase activator NlpD
MAERRWTLVIVPHGAGASTRLQVSTAVMKMIAGGAATLLLGALVFGYVTVSRKVDLTRSAQLELENALLAEELGRLHGQLTSITDTLDQIALRDSRYRVLADLDPINPQVLQAGIGGPTEPGFDDALSQAGVLGQRATEVRVDLNALIRRANLLSSSFDEAMDSLSSHNRRLAATPSIMPTQGWLSSSFKAMRMHPILHYARPHKGIDITAPKGAPIQAPAGGVVTSTGWRSGFGNTVTISHGYGVTTKYAHASKILVKSGERVKRGDRIALIGKTGLATAPHLHYEVHVNGRAVNPQRYVLPEEIGG